VRAAALYDTGIMRKVMTINRLSQLSLLSQLSQPAKLTGKLCNTKSHDCVRAVMIVIVQCGTHLPQLGPLPQQIAWQHP
jgi:hypothetical protein